MNDQAKRPTPQSLHRPQRALVVDAICGRPQGAPGTERYATTSSRGAAWAVDAQLVRGCAALSLVPRVGRSSRTRGAFGSRAGVCCGLAAADAARPGASAGPAPAGSEARHPFECLLVGHASAVGCDRGHGEAQAVDAADEVAPQ